MLTEEKRKEVQAMPVKEQAEFFAQMAHVRAKEKGISFREAAHEIKKQYPESRDAFYKAGRVLPV